ncbi:hypothetical protein QTJ16_005492 [Diplocarpon rosae]|uniref:Uncharacterized protein n=1 Tax=Diplocarpon rosae TaxID=946125 RepID=A0AAD9SXU9_9HELO|nr:hypothetical protein QTJ16_005492 [Diplocarpon rosae]
MRHTCVAYCMEIRGVTPKEDLGRRFQQVANLVPVTTPAGKITGDRGPGSRSQAWASGVRFETWSWRSSSGFPRQWWEEYSAMSARRGGITQGLCSRNHPQEIEADEGTVSSDDYLPKTIVAPNPAARAGCGL